MTAPIRTYSYAELAQLLGVNRKTLWRAVRRRELRATRLGSRVVFRETSVLEYLDRRTGHARPGR